MMPVPSLSFATARLVRATWRGTVLVRVARTSWAMTLKGCTGRVLGVKRPE